MKKTPSSGLIKTKYVDNTNEHIEAPFTPEQVEALNTWQSTGVVHPFTCGSGRRKDADHLDGEGILKATPQGWVCPYCNYTQDWAHAFMADLEALETMKESLQKQGFKITN